jgi:hypothetical protein
MCRSKLMNILSIKIIARDLSIGTLPCSMSSIYTSVQVQPFCLFSVNTYGADLRGEFWAQQVWTIFRHKKTIRQQNARRVQCQTPQWIHRSVEGGC